MFLSFTATALLLLQSETALAFGPGYREVLSCETSGGGLVRIAADSAKRVSLEFEGPAIAALGSTGDSDLPAVLESADSASTEGAVDLLEIGAGYFTNSRVGHSNCGLGLEFYPRLEGKIQPFAIDRHGHYHFVECEIPGGRRQNLDILSCHGVDGLRSVTDLKKFINIEVGD